MFGLTTGGRVRLADTDLIIEIGLCPKNPLRPQGKQVDYYDTHLPELVLRVNYGGAKIWRPLYYVKRSDKDGKSISIPTTSSSGAFQRSD